MENEEEKSLEQQIAEAEERGYRRGLNEQIERKMQEPGVWEGAEPPGETLQPAEFQILGNMRESIWNR